jgi:hypothetical protein
MALAFIGIGVFVLNCGLDVIDCGALSAPRDLLSVFSSVSVLAVRV